MDDEDGDGDGLGFNVSTDAGCWDVGVLGLEEGDKVREVCLVGGGVLGGEDGCRLGLAIGNEDEDDVIVGRLVVGVSEGEEVNELE